MRGMEKLVGVVGEVLARDAVVRVLETFPEL